jgi:hypothetical protein
LQVNSQFINSAGGDQPHNNMQPYIALNYMVKVQAAFDVIEEMQSQIEALQAENASITQQVSLITSILWPGAVWP